MVDARKCNQPILGNNQAALSVVKHSVAFYNIVVRIAIFVVPNGPPGPQVAPTRVERHHAGTLGVLHNGMVYRAARTTQKRLTVNTHKRHVCLSFVHSLLGRIKDVAAVAF